MRRQHKEEGLVKTKPQKSPEDSSRNFVQNKVESANCLRSQESSLTCSPAHCFSINLLWEKL